ncbi:MAG TPA: dihydroorotase [Bacteroidetes bacterium]|nr:dihydroorotase [Bacteroidota bacterium]
MQLLIKNAILVDPASKYHGERVGILIKKGRIDKVGKRFAVAPQRVFDAGGAFVSPGWLDIGTLVGDPGFEHREDFRTVEKAAAAGGYTAIACLPNTSPAIHSKSEVLYIKNSAKNSRVDFLPIGAVSQNCAGKDITEMCDMRAAGAVAFSDGKNPIADSGLMMRALQYVQPFGGVIINQPLNQNVAQNGQLHEGVVSTSLGLRGIPGIAEELMVQRDIYLSEYTGSKLHLLNISTAESVRLVRLAKKKGLNVTASVSALHLAFTDEALLGFDSNFKVLPPLRSEKDRKALIAGLKDGTIDCITSNHTPLEAEAKELEFLYAQFGAIGLQTAFPLAFGALYSHLPVADIIAKFAFGPRQVLGLPAPSISVGQQADLTLFDPNAQWSFNQKNILSKSKNTPLTGKTFKGKIIGTFRGESWSTDPDYFRLSGGRLN